MAFSVAAVILAAGASTRMAGRGSKALLPVGGRPILDWSLALFQSVACVDRIVVVTAEGDREMVTSLCQGYPKVATPVMGGPTRHDSEYRGLTALADSIDEGKIDTLLVHDAARPFARAELVERLVAAANQSGAAIPAVPAPDTLVQAGDGTGDDAPESYWAAQTPQAFSARTLLDAHRRAHEAGFRGTDTASVLEWAGGSVAVVEGSYDNLKITTPEDLVRAEQIAGRGASHASVLGPETFGA
jgi:2-C-methyl-D-erythritol 4-phosphate cytidylyltransferase